MIKETETGREGRNKPLVEYGGPNNEQDQGISAAPGPIWVQETPLGPGEVGGAPSPVAQGAPRGCSRLPPRDRDLNMPLPSSLGSQAQVLHHCYSIRPRMLHASLESIHQSSGVSPEPGGRRGVLAPHPSSCLVHPTKEGRDQGKQRKVSTDEGARLAAEMEPLKPAETQHSCNSSNTSPLTADLSQTQGLQGRKGALEKPFTGVCKGCRCFITDHHRKNPSTRKPPTMVASSGDALPHDQKPDLHRLGENKERTQISLDAGPREGT